MRKSWIDTGLWGLAAAILVMAAAIWISGSIKSQAADTLKAQEVYYEQLEREYIGQVRCFLSERGYRNSGVTLGRIVDNEGHRSYTVLIHHSAMDILTQEQLADLLKQVENMGFYVPCCSFAAKRLR